VADYLRDPVGYDPERSFAAAIENVGARGADALAVLADHFRGHPVLAAELAAPHLAQLAGAVFGAASPGEESLAELARHLGEASRCGERLAGSLDDPLLCAELAPFSAKLGALADAALAGLDAIAGRRSADEFRTLRKAAETGVERIACTKLPESLRPFVAGAGRGVDHFADLFAAIEARLVAQGSDSTVVT
jgi:hypothetical protein